MKTPLIISISALSLLSVVAVLGLVKTHGINEELEKLKTEHSELSAVTEDLGSLALDQTLLLERKEETIVVLDSLISLREGFDGEIAKAQEALKSAENKVDVTAEKNFIIEAQNLVMAERIDGSVIEAQKAVVTAKTGEITAKVEAYDAEQLRLAQAREAARRGSGGSQSSGGGNQGSNAGGGGDYYSQMRGILNSVGGGGVYLAQVEVTACGNRTACSLSSGTIQIGPDLAGWSTWRKTWAMTHEYAHQFQFNQWSTINNSGTYASLFGGNHETAANCMAGLRGYAVISCSGSQNEYAQALWNGSAW